MSPGVSRRPWASITCFAIGARSVSSLRSVIWPPSITTSLFRAMEPERTSSTDACRMTRSEVPTSERRALTHAVIVVKSSDAT
jgi:hypothetical protein